MPQISKVRIANFTYNDGKRMIADELFDFADKENHEGQNTLINLKNGGGKSVFVQLMLQPIHPKAKVSARKIESFFTRASDHCFIAIEWIKDKSTEKLMTGIAMASGDSAVEDDSEGRQVKYYTFLSNYTAYTGKYDIIHLPFTRRQDGSFVAAAFNEIRDLARKSSGELDYYPSDDSRQWRERLAEYGIIQEEWKNIVEEINSVEGGMMKFFERFRESKQLLDQLLIPTIEGKFGQTMQKDEDASLSTMLMEHAKAYNKQEDLIDEKASCEHFCNTLVELNELTQGVWTGHDHYEKQLQEMTGFYNGLSEKCDQLETLLQELDTAKEKLQKELTHIEYEECSEAYYRARTAFEQAEGEYRNTAERQKKAKEALTASNHRIRVLECANLSMQINTVRNELKAIREEIKAKAEDSDLAEHIQNLAFTVHNLAKERLSQTEAQISDYKKQLEETGKQYDTARTEEQNAQNEWDEGKAGFTRAEEALKVAREESDKIVQRLELVSMRWLDGCYHSEELEQEKQAKKAVNDQLEDRQEARKNLALEKKKRNTKIDKEKLSLQEKKSGLSLEQKQTEEKFRIYQTAEEQALALCSLYNLEASAMFCGTLMGYVSSASSEAYAVKARLAVQQELVRDEMEAAVNGHAYVPKRVIQFLEDNGISYQTCERYLNSIMDRELPKEKGLAILHDYPSLAYGIILDEKERKKLSAVERDVYEWLPSMVPVFSHEQMEWLLSYDERENEGGVLSQTAWNAIALYSIAYFTSKEEFIQGLKEKQQNLQQENERIKERIQTLEQQKKVAEAIAEYSKTARKDFEKQLERLAKQILEAEDSLQSLDEEKEANEKEQTKIEEEMETNRQALQAGMLWLEHFAELMGRIGEETEKEEKKNQAYTFRQAAEKKWKECQKKSGQLQSDIENWSGLLQRAEEEAGKLAEVLVEVGDTSEGEPIEGVWESLLEEYRELKKAQGKELDVLREREANKTDSMKEKTDRLNAYDIPETEYSSVKYVEADFRAEKKNSEALSEESERLQEEVLNANGKKERSQAQFENVEQRLLAYGQTPLEISEMKGNYADRKKDITEKGRDVELRFRKEAKQRSDAQRIVDRTKEFLMEHKEVSPLNGVRLAEDFTRQYEDIRNRLLTAKKEYDQKARQLSDSLQREIASTAGYRMDELQALKRFEQLLLSETISGDKFFTLSEQLEAVRKATGLRAAQIETDLKEFEKSKSDLVRQCVIQGKRIFDGLRSMSKSSAISMIPGKPRKQMLRIDIPDEVDAGIAENSIETELDTGILELVKLLKEERNDADIKKTVDRIISSQTLFRKYVGKDQISVEVYKIDINPENAKYRTWEATQIKNSGGEKLVLYFAVILSLINYARSDYGDLNDKSLTSVLILDNPFGPISSEHLLKPMFEIAKHFRVQMICLSDLNKVDITACFDNFIKAVIRPIKLSSVELLTHEGNEEIEHGFYKSEQMRLF